MVHVVVGRSMNNLSGKLFDPGFRVARTFWSGQQFQTVSPHVCVLIMFAHLSQKPSNIKNGMMSSLLLNSFRQHTDTRTEVYRDTYSLSLSVLWSIVQSAHICKKYNMSSSLMFQESKFPQRSKFKPLNYQNLSVRISSISGPPPNTKN